MKKSQVPTSTYKVFCDTFDMAMTMAPHASKGKQKLLLEMESEDGKKKQSLSLFAEDVRAMAAFLESVGNDLDNRN